MEDKMIYLDQNIISKIINKEDGYIELETQLNKLSKDGYSFPYSPAHIEEIYSGPIDKSKIFLDFISEISKDMELLPLENGPIVTITEKPIKCFERVKKYDTREIIQEMSRSEVAFKNENQYKKYTNSEDVSDDISSEFVSTRQKNDNTFNLDRIYNLSAKEFIKDPFIINQLKTYNKNLDISRDVYMRGNINEIFNLKFSPSAIANQEYMNIVINNVKKNKFKLDLSTQFEPIKNCFSGIEEHLQNLFHFFNYIGVHPDKKTKKHISSEYDISHAIYATKAKYLITNDDKFYKKVLLAYGIFGVPTKVIKSIDIDKIEV